jgi:mono/diheme cytochrome c family protein
MLQRARDDVRRARGCVSVAFVTLSLATVLVAACGDDEPAAPATGGDGAALYAASCASCHGADLRGTGRGPSHLSVVYAPDHHPDESFRRAAREGVTAHHWNFGDMPSVRGLDDDEIDAIITFVRAEQDEQGFEPYPP